MDFHNILVPTDFSDNSLNAIQWGCEIAEKSGANVHILHSYEYSATYAQVNYLSFMESVAESINKNLLEDMKTLEKKIPKLAALNVHYEVSFNSAIKGISDYTQNNNIDLIIMGTRGKNDFTNRLIGSITSAIIDQTSVPVLAIPENHIPQDIKTIIYADDFKHIASEKILDTVARMAELYKATIKILHITKETENGSSIDTDEMLKDVKIFSNTPHTYAFSINKKPDEGILEFIKKEKADLLVVLPQKHGFFFTLFKKSVTESVVHKITIPMLAIKGNK